MKARILFSARDAREMLKRERSLPNDRGFFASRQAEVSVASPLSTERIQGPATAPEVEPVPSDVE
jgi:hypothetical protein